METTPIDSLLPEGLINVISSIIPRLADPKEVDCIMSRQDNALPLYGHHSSINYAAIVILLTEIKSLFEDEPLSPLIHEYVILIKESLENSGINNASISSGLAGICHAIAIASKSEGDYQKLQKSLDTYLIGLTKEQLCTPLKVNIANGVPSYLHLYDAIQGITGVGAYFIAYLQKPFFKDMAEELVTLCLKLCQPLIINNGSVPGWLVPPDDPFSWIDEPYYAEGHFNLGLAHGVTGILAFLSIAYLKGIKMEGQIESIKKLSSWIWERRKEEVKRGVFWERKIPNNPLYASIDEPAPAIFDGWCYGAPGNSRVLYLSAEVLQEPILKSFAWSAFNESVQRILITPPLTTSFCHGTAGILAMANRMYQNNPLPSLKVKIELLESMILSKFNEQAPFGFKEPIIYEGLSYELDRLGLIDGASGILLSLLSSYLPEPSLWDCPFLIH